MVSKKSNLNDSPAQSSVEDMAAFKLDYKIPGLIAKVFQLRDADTDDGIKNLLTLVLLITVDTPPTRNQITEFVSQFQHCILSRKPEVTEEFILEVLREFGSNIKHIMTPIKPSCDGEQSVSGTQIPGSSIGSDESKQSEQEGSETGDGTDDGTDDASATSYSDTGSRISGSYSDETSQSTQDEASASATSQSDTDSRIYGSDSDETSQTARDAGAETGTEPMDLDEEKQSCSDYSGFDYYDGSSQHEHDYTEAACVKWQEYEHVLKELFNYNNRVEQLDPDFILYSSDGSISEHDDDARSGAGLMQGFEQVQAANTTLSPIEPTRGVQISRELIEAAQTAGLILVDELSGPTVTQEDVSVPEISAPSDNVEEMAAEEQDDLRRSSRIKATKRKHDKTQ